MPNGSVRPDWLVELEDLANRIEHGLPLDDEEETLDYPIGERSRLTLIQGGGESSGGEVLAPLPTTRAELRLFCERLEAQLLNEPGGDHVA